MKSTNCISYLWDEEEYSIDFNKPHWSDQDNNFMKCLGSYFEDKEGRKIMYKDDLIP